MARKSAKTGSETAQADRAASHAAYPEVMLRLIDELARLPGVGRRSAERLAFHILKSTKDQALALSRAISDVKQNVRPCRICSNLAGIPGDPQGALCAVCSDPRRDRSLVMVVEQPRDLLALEQTGMYRGIYHVLMGRISPLDGVGPSDLTVSHLLERVDDPNENGGEAIAEVVLGLNPTLEGDGTALYLAEELARRGVKVTRLARGVPTGSQLEYANKAVLADAIEGRQPIS
jgi:recombination protein RecR